MRKIQEYTVNPCVGRMPERVNPSKAESQMTLASAKSVSEDRTGGWWARRTRMERYLVLTVLTVLFAVMCLVVALAAVITGVREGQTASGFSKHLKDVRHDLRDNICLTEGCVKAAASVLSRMDSKANPCDDFFQFACGTYVEETTIPEEKTSISQFTEINDVLKKKLRTIIEADISEEDSSSTRMVKNFYKSCMNTERIESEGIEPLRKILKLMGGWPVVEGDSWNSEYFKWYDSVYTNRRLGYSVDYLMDFSVTANIKNSTERIIDIDQAGLGMPSRKYLLKGFNDSDVQAYYNYQVKMATMLGADPLRAKKELKESLDFETKIAEYGLPKEDRRNATKLYNKMTLRDLYKLSPDIPWLEYVRELLTPEIEINEEEWVIVNVPSYVQKLGVLLRETPARTIANYLMWRVSSSSVSYLSDAVRDLQLEYSRKITGKVKRESRWKECMGAVAGSVPHAVGSLYVKKFFKEDSKASADEMVSYLRSEFDKVLHRIDWMDPLTKARALNKSRAIVPHIGYPQELIMDHMLQDLYEGLEITDGDLLTSMRNLTLFGTDYSFKRLREPVLKNDWKNHGGAAVVNAFYSPVENSIQFPAGILQGTFFEADRPSYLNFGAIGYVIGHEITHGFDDTGRQFDLKGDLKDWWEPLTKEKFLDKAKCIIYQYGNYTHPAVGMQLNGINTQGENIADNGGIKGAYFAYNQWTADNGEERGLPGLPYSPRQLFWLSAANVWCGVYRPETLKLRILTGAHSPAQFRVNGPFSNFPEFAKDWQCPLGSKMNPYKKCAVW